MEKTPEVDSLGYLDTPLEQQPEGVQKLVTSLVQAEMKAMR